MVFFNNYILGSFAAADFTEAMSIGHEVSVLKWKQWIKSHSVEMPLQIPIIIIVVVVVVVEGCPGASTMVNVVDIAVFLKAT